MVSRRGVLVGLGASAAGSVPLGSQAAFAQFVPSSTSSRQAIQSLHLSILISLATNNTEGARRQAQRLGEFSKVDPNWFTYSESYSIAVILFKLTPEADYRNWLSAARGVVECTPSMNGNVIDNTRVMAKATEVVLKAVMAGQYPDLSSKKVELANYLMVWAGAAPGAERVGWARYGASVLKALKVTISADLVSDSAPDLRFAAIAVGLSGDWAGALQLQQRYQSALDLPGGKPRMTRSQAGGYKAFSAGRESFDAEIATAMAMTGRVADALVQLEKSRRRTPSLVKLPASPGLAEILKIEERLLGSGTVVINVAATIAGTLFIVSSKIGGKVTRTVHLSVDSGGILLPSRTVNSGAFHFKQDGLLSEYNNARKEKSSKRLAKISAYVKRAAGDAEMFVGSGLRAALIKAKVPATADVLLVQPAAVAFLPLALVGGENNGRFGLGRPLRFADSMTSAASAEACVRLNRSTRPRLGVMALAPQSGGPAFAPFEAAAVRAVVTSAKGEVDAQNAPEAKVLEWPSGRTYWHISSHASWNAAKPELSGISLGGKKVARISDVAALRLLPAPRLVFLSCCETALLNTQEEIDKYLSLPTAFLSIGVGGVIASHWPVSDAASALLATRFYHEHLLAAKVPVEALVLAQKWLAGSTAGELSQFLNALAINDVAVQSEIGEISTFLLQQDSGARPFSDPYYWGGFQLYGA